MDELRVETPVSGVRLLTLFRPAKRNALSFELIRGLYEQLRQAEREGARALVIAAEGPTFSAGADFSQLKGDRSDLAFDDAMSELTAALMRSPLISFAAIHGGCIGAGIDLALACDFRVASSDAFFALPAVKLGILYNPRRLFELGCILTPSTLRRLLVLAETLNCDDAMRGGIVTHRSDGGQTVLQTALDHASRAAQLPPRAQHAAKSFMAQQVRRSFEEEEWQRLRLELLASGERRMALQNARKSGK